MGLDRRPASPPSKERGGGCRVKDLRLLLRNLSVGPRTDERRWWPNAAAVQPLPEKQSQQTDVFDRGISRLYGWWRDWACVNFAHCNASRSKRGGCKTSKVLHCALSLDLSPFLPG